MRALLLIDIQNDFMPTGALPVPRGDEVVGVANRLQPDYDLVVASQDWHPPDHGSFAANHAGKSPGETVELDGLRQILWPVHCVQGTPGAEFHPGLDRARVAHVVRKGTDPTIDSYSAFFDNAQRRDTGLGDWLKARGVDAVDVIGLATDYCVRFSALDARRLGLRVRVLLEGCRGVELNAGDCDAAVEEMRAAGAEIA